MDHITVCICTYQRPRLLKRLLQELERQQTEDRFTYSVVVVDNDEQESAKSVVSGDQTNSSLKTRYFVEAARNIAMARNKAVNNAEGDYLAFIDDDEFPGTDWLLAMFKTLKEHGVSGVLGPVLPYFEVEPPQWVKQAGFYNRPTHDTGFVLGWQEARTGNVLLARRILAGTAEAFRPQFGTGGEDQDFFRRMMERGEKFLWCNEAPVYELVPPHRWDRRFLLRRALLRGEITSRQARGRVKNAIKSIIAVPLYTVALPFLFLLGQHLFMKYLVRLFDHVGRLLAWTHLNPVKERNN